MLLLRSAALLLLLSACCASAFAAPSLADLERANYIVDVKVVKVDGTTAVCRVNDILLGLVAYDGDKCVRVNVKPGDVKTGDRFVLFAPSAELNRKYGMVMPGDVRADGAATKELRNQIWDRTERAKKLIDTLGKDLPGAADAVEKALTEFDKGGRGDFDDLTPEADLLLDMGAVAHYEPDLGDVKRPAIDDATAKKFTRLALRALCGLSKDGAETAAGLVEGKGNGVFNLLRPAELEAGKAKAILRKLAGSDEMDGVAKWLLHHDVENRVAGWISELACGGDATSEKCEWLLVEACGEGWLSTDNLQKVFAPKASPSLPYAGQHGLCLARALDAKAWRLAAWLMLTDKPELPIAENVQASKESIATRNLALEGMYGRDEMLQVYAYALAMRGADDAGVKAVRGKLKVKGDVNLSDISSLEFELRHRGKFNAALRRAVKHAAPEMR